MFVIAASASRATAWRASPRWRRTGQVVAGKRASRRGCCIGDDLRLVSYRSKCIRSLTSIDAVSLFRRKIDTAGLCRVEKHAVTVTSALLEKDTAESAGS